MSTSTTPRDRSTFIGASDVAAIMGLSKWRTPLDVYFEKTGQISEEDQARLQRREQVLQRGRILEPFIREMTVQKLRDEGHDVEVIGTNEVVRDKRYPFLEAELDWRMRVDGEEMNADAKSVNAYARDGWGAPGSEDVPIYYAAQFMQGLGLTPGKPKRCLAAALKSFDDVDLYWTVRDEETIEAMREKCVRFWKDHVKKRRPPDPVNFADLTNMFPKAKPASIEIDDETRERVERVRDHEQRVKRLEEAIAHEKFWIARYMGEHALLTDGVRNVMQWDHETRSRLDVRAFKRDHPDWAALYLKETSPRVLRWAAKR